MTISTSEQLWESLVFPADDGQFLRGRWFEPIGRRRGVVVIVPAMATTAAYYATFASWLRDRGFAVLTFDYRGYGAVAHRADERGRERPRPLDARRP